jgi:LCP family protein required for cell wall assembly
MQAHGAQDEGAPDDGTPDDRAPDDGAPDRSEQAERARRAKRASGNRAVRIDETLTRLTAAHAGLVLPLRDGDVPPPTEPQRRRRPTAGKIVAAALALLVLVTTTVGFGAKSWLGSAIRDAAALDPESGAIVDAELQQGDENVLVVAAESDSAKKAETRADTVAVAHIPAGGGPLVVLSFPPDLEINRPPCERWDAGSATYLDETVPAEARTRLVSAIDVGGPRCATRVVQQLSGLAITKYVGMDLGAAAAVADAVGGVEVCVPAPLLDRVLGPVVPDAGTSTLTGMRAADFVRAGDVPGDPSSEYGRIERQQKLLAAVLGEAVSSSALLDVGRLGALRPALGAALVADGAGLDEVLALARSLHRLDAAGVTFAAVPTAGEANNRGNAVLRGADASALFGAVREDAPLPEQVGGPAAAETGPVPGDVTVQVLNASGRSGLAGQIGETLRSLGFGVGEVGNAEQPTPQTVIRFSPDQAAAAALLATTVPSATSVPNPGATGVLQLVLGRSFDDVVRAPAEPVAVTTPGPATAEGATATCA